MSGTARSHWCPSPVLSPRSPIGVGEDGGGECAEGCEGTVLPIVHHKQKRAAVSAARWGPEREVYGRSALSNVSPRPCKPPLPPRSSR